MDGKFVNVVPEKSFDYYLRMVTLVIGLCMLVVSLLGFISSFFGLSPSGIIVNFYIILFSSMIILTEIELRVFLTRVRFLTKRFWRGVFYFFVGTLPLAVLAGGILSYILIGLGVVLILDSFLYMGYGAINRKAEESGFGRRYASVDVESQDSEVFGEGDYNSSFDPSTVASPSRHKMDVADDDAARAARRVKPIDDSEYAAAGLEDYVHTQVSTAVAGKMRDKETQQRMGAAVGQYATDAEYQRSVGDSIARGSDNEFVKYMATNETVQKYAGQAVSSAATNEKVQGYVGDQLARAAEDKEMHKKVGRAAGNAAKSGASSGWDAANAYVLSDD